MKKRIDRPELLCPAGSPEAFKAAIEGGADAIYVGGTDFNARINAKNFTREELSEAIKLAHAYGVKVYVAANTIIFDKETDAMLRAAEDAYLCGADALIVADLGAAKMIKRRIPIALHASTQAAGHNAEAAKYLAELGFSRMVCAREMGREELRSFVQGSPIEAEVFVHGALCVCHSGQCLFSSLVGGRSGNRGQCAQPCRLPFKGAKTEYPLSLKDLSLARYVPELCEMGIASFKIEGRMKSPEYVRDTAMIWRRLIDEGRGADSREMAELAGIFSRGGFTDGYYVNKIDRNMLGVRSEADKRSTDALVPFERITRRVPVSMSASLRVGAPMSLTVSDGSRRVSVEGATPEAARTAPLSVDAVRKNLTKLGSTPYEAKEVSITVDGELMVPLSSVNALRRAAIEALEWKNPRSEADFLPVTKEDIGRTSAAASIRSAHFYFPERIPNRAREYFDVIFVPLEKYDGSSEGVSLPPVIYDGDMERTRTLLDDAKKRGCKYVLVGNVGHIGLAKNCGLIPWGDLRLNIANSLTARHFGGELERMILSPELDIPKLRDIVDNEKNATAIVYGRVPLMVTEKCVGKEISDCKTCTDGGAVLTDRRGVSFPVLRETGHRSLIVNSVPVYMADRSAELKRAGIFGGHFIFTVESEGEIIEVIDAYENATAPKGSVRRIK